ncbi:uncharacterized protein LOC128557591 [Mercenaria mercenaria]|uniref:uncharacterized protein LOC128557591 n=1 Tax=Mercenaria mercenaria TaxID=6596 RepID=UPI00234ED696|nr:uncharacterized protein LOC128557591 [Mercenaria mercenaria]
MRPLFIITITAVVFYLLLYHFYFISRRTFITERPRNSSLGRTRQIHLASDYIESSGHSSADDSHRSVDNSDRNLTQILDAISNLTKDVDEIKLTLKQMNIDKKWAAKDSFMETKYSTNRTLKSTSLLTIFSTWTRNEEKSNIYNNTLKNWASFKPVLNPVLFTNDSVLAKDAAKAGWTVTPLTKTADNGLPVLKYMYINVIKNFDSTFYCYANSDILFDDGLVQTLVHLVYKLDSDILSSTPVFLTGLRWNVINVLGNEISPRQNLKALIKSRGKVFVTSAEDYFITNKIYPWQDIPEIVVGSIAYDNWLVYNARDKKHLTINTSRTIAALHQSLDENNHRSHVRDTVNHNANLLMDIYKINLPYHRGFIECIEKFTDFVNDTFVLGDRMVSQYCN